MRNQNQMEFHFYNGTLEEIGNISNLKRAFILVKRNKGAPGIDGKSIKEFEADLLRELEQLKEEILGWTYRSTPVKRVEILKRGGKGSRLLGIPTVKDRVLHTAIKEILEIIIDPSFSRNSYGFRPGRNQRQAVEAAREIVRSGSEYVVDIDLSKFFDKINHDRLIYPPIQVSSATF